MSTKCAISVLKSYLVDFSFVQLCNLCNTGHYIYVARGNAVDVNLHDFRLANAQDYTVDGLEKHISEITTDSYQDQLYFLDSIWT